jgi:hypothetical protein
MSGEVHGLLDTNILILRRRLDHAQLPDVLSISAVTLAELSAGPHHAGVPAERARRVVLLQQVEAEFDPLPFDTDAARVYGSLVAGVLAAGRTPRRRIADLMIASTAIAWRLPLYTTNPQDFVGLDSQLHLVPVDRPA